MAESKKPGRVKSALLNWLGVPVGLTNGAFWQDLFGTSASGKVVTVDAAMQLSTVWSCVRLLSETISTLPFKLYQRQSDGSRVSASNHPLYRVLCQSPNAEMTPSRFMSMIVASLALWGNAYVEKRYVGTRIVALIPLLPQLMKVKRLDNGRLEYTYVEDGAERKFAEKDLMHIRALGLDGVCGMLPVYMGRNVIGSAMSTDEAAGKIFANGMQASGVLTHESGPLKPEQREQLRQSLNAFAGSANAGKLMVLEAGLKYQGITLNPEAAQMLQTRAFQVEEICRWFRIPPHMVGHMDKQSSWASSVEGMNLQFLTNVLRPILKNIEDEVARCLIGFPESDSIYGEFSVEGMLRADINARTTFYSTALQNGWMNRDEVRRLENMPPIPGGDVHTVQSNLLPIELLGQSQAPLEK